MSKEKPTRLVSAEPSAALVRAVRKHQLHLTHKRGKVTSQAVAISDLIAIAATMLGYLPKRKKES